jgi:hypothetical protein
VVAADAPRDSVESAADDEGHSTVPAGAAPTGCGRMVDTSAAGIMPRLPLEPR